MTEINPYEAATIASPNPRKDGDELRGFVWWRSAIVWMLVCWISAAPSYFLAIYDANVRHWAPMVAGVMTFVAGYILLDYRTFNWKFRRRKPVRIALITTYVIRILISIFFPVALFLDVICGLISSFVLYPVGIYSPRQDLSVGAIYLWTIAQGFVLNAVLGIVWACLFALFALLMGPDPIPFED